MKDNLCSFILSTHVFLLADLLYTLCLRHRLAVLKLYDVRRRTLRPLYMLKRKCIHMAITMETIQANFNTSHVHTHLEVVMAAVYGKQGPRARSPNDEEKHEEHLHHND